jgi:hypothetical protein
LDNNGDGEVTAMSDEERNEFIGLTRFLIRNYYYAETDRLAEQALWTRSRLLVHLSSPITRYRINALILPIAKVDFHQIALHYLMEVYWRL